ncbi:MAG: recombinase RecA [Ruminococcaceae bacterium]|nr:recombinase RecA [Oscillospiraceae bacterium]
MPKTEKTTKAKTEKDADTKEGKLKAIQTAMGQIEKKYGKGSIMKLGENSVMNVSAISTGSLSLDLALGIGGVPRGRIIEIYGPESSGKTTVALQVIASAQKAGGAAAFIDAEHALDPVYAKALGVDIDNLLVSQPDSGEQALEIAEALVRTDAIDVIVIDSVAALVPRSEIEGEMGQSSVGVQARLMSQALRKIAGAIAKSQCAFIFINQLREKVGVMYGNPEVTTGGRALRFYSSVRIDVRRGEQLKEKGDVVGNHIKCKIAKNKVAPPFRVAEFDILYGQGISRESEIIEIALKFDIIQKSGSWFSYNGERLAQGKENVRLFLKDHPELAEKIAEKAIAMSKEGLEEKVSGESLFDSDEEDDDELGLGDLE